jgi:hypothetical protein
MADIDSRDMFFYSRKADFEKAYHKACEVDQNRANEIVNGDGSLLEKLIELEIIVGDENE